MVALRKSTLDHQPRGHSLLLRRLRCVSTGSHDIFCWGLSFHFNSKTIHIPHRDDGRGTGHGYVQLALSQAVTAIDQLNGLRLQKRKIFIQMSPSDPEPEPSPPSESSPISADDSSDDEMDISDDSDDESGNESSNNIPASAQPLDDKQTNVPADTDERSFSDESVLSDAHNDEDRMDLESSDASSEYSPEPAAIPSHSVDQSQPNGSESPKIADDLAPELQPAAEQQIATSHAVCS